jgi:hypothetical protein
VFAAHATINEQANKAHRLTLACMDVSSGDGTVHCRLVDVPNTAQ